MRISTLIATGTSVAAAAAVGSLASRPAVQSSWYARLRKPRYQPPEIVFPVVWPMLYADIAVVSASTIDELQTIPVNADDKRDKSPIALGSPL